MSVSIHQDPTMGSYGFRTDDRLTLTGLHLSSRIAFGIFITSYGETEFNATGFWLVIGEGGFCQQTSGKLDLQLKRSLVI